MFKKPFSFNGRIRRTEYGLSWIIYMAFAFIAMFGLTFAIAVSQSRGQESSGFESLALFLLYIPMLWFMWAQGAKRCHDVGNSGWYQLIPFYVLYLLFADGNRGPNEYGDDPKQPAQEEYV